jgi:hypothetical protein
VAAAQRFVEATSLELVRRRSNDPLLANHLQTLAGTPSDSSIQNAEQIKESDIVDRTLSELQTIIAQHAPKAG